jgi:hypothetical protein
MELADKLSVRWPKYLVTPPNVRFTIDDEEGWISLEALRVLVAIHGPNATAERCISAMQTVMGEWRKVIGDDLPKYSRVGFRSQVFYASDMTREELVDVYDHVLFSSELNTLYAKADFALTLESLKGVDGVRVVLGAMHHDELLAKWTPSFTIEPHGTSYFVVDLDYGASDVHDLAFESFVRAKWADVIKRCDWIFAPLR